MKKKTLDRLDPTKSEHFYTREEVTQPKKNFSAPPRSGFGRLERRPRTDEGPAPSGRCRRDADDAG